ncbi:MAG: PCP reductase family protein [Promethearchaeota archaeon]
MSEYFENIRILDNFYQTSSFYPMPVVFISTLNENGETNLGPYSLCFPFIISGENQRAMLLISRESSNTSKNIQREKVCAINFIEFDKKQLKNAVELGFPGETTQEKMKNSIFTLIPSFRSENEKEKGKKYPKVIAEAFQIFECTWQTEFPLFFYGNEQEAHFVLKIDKILMKKKYKDTLIEGKGGKFFPKMPIDFGFRNNAEFYFAKHSKPYSEPIPESKKVDISSIKYATTRIDPDYVWEDEACEKLTKVPRIFLKTVIKACIEEAEKRGIKKITPEFLDEIRDKRAAEKKKKS